MARKAARARLPNRFGWRLRLTVFVGFLSVLGVIWRSGWQAPLPTAPLTGQARVVDGDGLRLGNDVIRLIGIDAPERDQTCQRDGRDYACGREAADRLAALIAGRQVRCIAKRHDRYQRLLGACTAGDIDLNQRMVATGWAVGYEDQYRAEEATAKAAGLGLWRGTFERPRAFRREQGDAMGWWSWLPW